MGVYEPSGQRKANGATVFVKRGVPPHYLYRHSNGKWMVANSESSLNKELGHLRSLRAADLPSETGLEWQYYSDPDWKDDANLTCTQANGLPSPVFDAGKQSVEKQSVNGSSATFDGSVFFSKMQQIGKNPAPSQGDGAGPTSKMSSSSTTDAPVHVAAFSSLEVARNCHNTCLDVAKLGSRAQDWESQNLPLDLFRPGVHANLSTSIVDGSVTTTTNAYTSTTDRWSLVFDYPLGMPLPKLTVEGDHAGSVDEDRVRSCQVHVAVRRQASVSGMRTNFSKILIRTSTSISGPTRLTGLCY